MKLPAFPDSPYRIEFSFYPLIERLEKVAAQSDGAEAIEARELLAEIAKHPELRNGIEQMEQITDNAPLIHRLLKDIFPTALTFNEIKAVCLPYIELIFNHTERFKKILNAAGPDFTFAIRDFDQHQSYITSCCLILNELYGTKFDFSRPLFYDIPNAEGIIKHYRILYNADFLEIVPNGEPPLLTPEEIDNLLDNYHDLKLWKSKFPKESYTLKGFAIMNLVDATVENAVSILKGKLLNPAKYSSLKNDLETIFRSIFNVNSIRVGFTSYLNEENKFTPAAFTHRIQSYMLSENISCKCDEMLMPSSFETLIVKEQYLAVSDGVALSKQYPESKLLKHFVKQKIKSFILAPIVKNGVLLGVLEVVSLEKRALHSVNANKLGIVMPYITDTIDRAITEYHNQIQAVIQNEYTTIHPSVQWKFRHEAKKFIQNRQMGNEYVLKEIVFEEVHPLYGQIDIRGSSDVRNYSVQKDIHNQLNILIPLMQKFNLSNDEALLEDMRDLGEFAQILTDFSLPVRTDKEEHIHHLIETRINPMLRRAQQEGHELAGEIEGYFDQLDKELGEFFHYRRQYDASVSIINQKLTLLLDEKQKDAQAIFPHYYERFKTDGVEHNLYIGASIMPTKRFQDEYVRKLRLWQLQTLCEMEYKHHKIKPMLPYPLEVTTLILAFNSTLSIRFRMDEKHFDVDGTYNARFAMVKKRIDKAHIAGTQERIVDVGKITIVYANEADEAEYLQYIATMQAKNILGKTIEHLEVEELPGVIGLKALRVDIIHPQARAV
ncbi:hypothetical protein C8P68_10816 [Mucilaginibacter yixingensis]|uniref:GAF domain-containing protein n=1 Tax=Mucilaginibacter yixingensis TaxID=1295612 RepID=A0A2T5J5N2_9SPHI|nr:GAF domain-containing protein [Mucilaginibacter yixingensis]PTQ93554.1 hypothetical protein C8P68_10816 [Mucilaginibacter yixingensis]